MDAFLSARPSSSAFPPHHSTPLKKAFSEQKCRVDTMTQLHRGSHCLFHTIYIVLFCGFRHELGSQSAHSFQDWFLKSRSRPPPTLEDLSKEWLSKIFGILFHKLFFVVLTFACTYLEDCLPPKKWTLFYSCFLHYQFSWFNIVTMPKCTSGRYTSKCPFFFLKKKYFFLGFASLPMSGCWQHHCLAFHSPSRLVPLLQKHEDLGTNYKNSFCMFNINSIILLWSSHQSNPTMRVQLGFWILSWPFQFSYILWVLFIPTVIP